MRRRPRAPPRRASRPKRQSPCPPARWHFRTVLPRRRRVRPQRPRRARTDRAAAPLYLAGAADRHRGRPRRDVDDGDARHRSRHADDRRLDRASAHRHRRGRSLFARLDRAQRRVAGRHRRRRGVHRDHRRPQETAGRAMRRAGERRNAGGAVLDADAVRYDRTSGGQFAAALRLHQPGNHPRLRRRVRGTDRGALARRQLAADRRHRALRLDAAALRHPGRRRHADATRCADAFDRHGGLPMIRLLFAIIGGVLLGGVVHLVSVLALPRIATQDAYSRLTPLTKLNTVTALPLAGPNSAPMPFMDPAFAIAVCRYDLSTGPIKLAVPVSQAYTSVSFYTRSDVAYYAINDRSAGRRVIELDLMTEAQHAELPEDEDITAADRLIIDSPTATGLIVLKALAPEPGLMPQAQAALAAASCKVQPEPPVKQAERPQAKR